MPRTPQDIQAAFFNVLKTDSAGATVRAALGDGANSVIDAEDLNSASLPTAPFLAMRWGPGGGPRRAAQRYYPTWWLYDDMGQKWRRIDRLLPLMKAAYSEDALSSCYTDFLPEGTGNTDESLKRRAKALPFDIRTR